MSNSFDARSIDTSENATQISRQAEMSTERQHIKLQSEADIGSKPPDTATLAFPDTNTHELGANKICILRILQWYGAA